MPMQVENLQDKKILKVTVNGFPTHEATEEVLKNYKERTAWIAPNTYSLIVDCTNMGFFVQDSISVLQNLFKFYMETGFKHIVCVRSKNPIQNMQFVRVTGMVPNYPGVFADTMEEAIEICSK